MRVNRRLDRENRHLHLYKDRPLPYHHTVAELCCKYAAPNEEILDLGCGRGEISILIKRKLPAARIFVADAYQSCLHAIQKEISIEQSYLLSESEFEVIHTINRQFGMIVMSHVLEHLSEPVRALREVMSLVRPGGHAILAVPNPARPDVLLSGLLRRHYVNPGHVVAWDRSHWINFLEEIMQLNVTEYASDYVAIPKLRNPAAEAFGIFLAKFLPWWSFSNIAVIESPARR